MRSAPERDGTRLLAATATVALVLDALELRVSARARALALVLALMAPAPTAAAASLAGAPAVLLLGVVGEMVVVVAAQPLAVEAEAGAEAKGEPGNLRGVLLLRRFREGDSPSPPQSLAAAQRSPPAASAFEIAFGVRVGVAGRTNSCLRYDRG